VARGRSGRGGPVRAPGLVARVRLIAAARALAHLAPGARQAPPSCEKLTQLSRASELASAGPQPGLRELVAMALPGTAVPRGRVRPFITQLGPNTSVFLSHTRRRKRGVLTLVTTEQSP
jgi:hypothetical protein